jgi:hypothetical protein
MPLQGSLATYSDKCLWIQMLGIGQDQDHTGDI